MFLVGGEEVEVPDDNGKPGVGGVEGAGQPDIVRPAEGFQAVLEEHGPEGLAEPADEVDQLGILAAVPPETLAEQGPEHLQHPDEHIEVLAGLVGGKGSEVFPPDPEIDGVVRDGVAAAVPDGGHDLISLRSARRSSAGPFPEPCRSAR